MRSLRARITAITVLVAVVAVLFTGLTSLQLIRTATMDEARARLAEQVTILAAQPGFGTAEELAQRATLAGGGTTVALVRDGIVTGEAGTYLDGLLLRRIQNSASVSATRKDADGPVAVEARRAGDGSTVVLALPLSTVDRTVGKVTARIVIALGIGLLVAIAGGTLVAGRLARPLTATAAGARRLAGGERGIPMPVSTTAEIADVASALAALDAALAASEARQREFLLSISHELRTPLTALRGYGEALADGLIPADEVAAVGATLVAETGRLDAFVADLLELARLEADDFTIAPSEVQVPALLAEVASAWAGRAAMVGASVTVVAEPMVIVTDANRLRQVLDGLVENALRVSPPGADVRLLGDGGVIRVLDEGPGLDEDDLAIAFDRGAVRARYAGSRPVGTGLGLSIAARLVRRLGGTISAVQRKPGGAEFIVTLPSGGVSP